MDNEGKLDRFGYNKLSVITFKYDISFEDHLKRRLIGAYNCSSEEADKELNDRDFRVIHVHGKIGEKHKNDTGEIFNRIKIIGECDQGPIIKSVLSDAEKIIFLGFGFHEVNLRTLGIKVLTNCQELEGTSHKTSKPLRDRTYDIIDNLTLYD